MAADFVGNLRGETHAESIERPVTSAVTVTSGDFVTITDGRVALPADGGKIAGVVNGGDTSKLASVPGVRTATGNAGGTVKVLVTVGNDLRYLVKASRALTAADEGDRFDLNGGTGAQVVDGTASATGSLLCVKANPGIRGTDNTYGIFVVVNDQFAN